MPWVRGQWWVVCDSCGFDYLSGKLKKRWDGLMVCGACYETRHPQEFVRSVKESTIPWSRPAPTDVDVTPAYPEWLMPPPVGNTNLFYGGEVTPGPVDVAPPLFANTNTIYGPEVRPSVTLAVDLLTNTNTIYAPTVAQTMLPDAFTNTNTFYAPTLGFTIYPDVFTNTNTFHSMSVLNWLQILEPSLFTNTSLFYDSTVAPGAITLTPSLVSNTNTFYAATVEQNPNTSMTWVTLQNPYDDGEGGFYYQIDVQGYTAAGTTWGANGSIGNASFAGPTTTEFAIFKTGASIVWTTSSSNATPLANYKGIEFTGQNADYGPYFFPFNMKVSSTSTEVQWYNGGAAQAFGTTDGYSLSGNVVLRGSDSVVSPFLFGYFEQPIGYSGGTTNNTITFKLTSDGAITIKDHNGTDQSVPYSGNMWWWSAKASTSGIGNNYWVKFTRTALIGTGASATATTSVLSLASDQSVTFTYGSGSGYAKYTVDIFSDSGGTTRVGRTKIYIYINA